MSFRVVPVRDRTLYALLKRSPAHALEVGERVWERGAPAEACAFVWEGLLVHRDSEGRAVAFVRDPDLTGLEALAESEPVYTTTLEARTPARVARVDGRAALRALRRGRRTLPILLEGLLGDRARARALRAGAGGSPARARLAAVVLDVAARLSDDGLVLPEAITHRDLAELAGLHRSTVTTALNDWIYEDLLRQRGRRLEITDAQGLEGLAREGRFR